ASLSGSEAALDEILKYSVIELARLLKADAAAVFFYDESLGELQAHIESVYGVPSDLYEQLGRIPVEEEFSKFIVTNSQQPFISDNTLEDQRILPTYRLLIDTLGVLSAVDVPLVFRGRGLGEIMLASNRYEHFNRSDIQLIKTVADQLAVAMERASLASQTDEDLRQRVGQLTALTRVGRELNTSLNLKRLLKRVYEEALKTTRADCGTILLFELCDSALPNPKVSLTIGDEPGKDLHPLEQVVLEKAAPVLVEDFDDPPKGLEESTLRPAHEGVHSTLILPIVHQGDVVGLFHLHARQPGRFDEAALQIAQALAVQAAVAIGNVQRYQEQVQENRQLSRRVKALSGLIEASGEARAEQSLEKSLRDMASRIREATSFPEVWVGVLEGEGTLEWAATAGVAPARLTSLRKSALKWSDVENSLISEYLLMSSYFIPIEKPAEVAEWLSLLADSHRRQEGHGAVLLQPFYKSVSRPLGLIAIASLPGDEYPDRVSLEILDHFSRQAGLVIDHHQWVDQLEFQIESLEAQLDASSETTQMLLAQVPHVHVEQRVNAVLEIIENLARQPDRLAVLEALGQGLISRLGLDQVLIVEMGAGGLQLLHVLGEIPPKLNLEALFGQRNPLRSSLNEGRLYLVADIEADEHWRQSPLLEALGAGGFLSLPILAQAGSPTAVLALSSSPLTDFSPDDEKLFDLLARQTATALNNLTLLTETGHRLREVYLLLEFSRQLGGVEAEKVLRLLVESALEVVQLAQACMAVVFEPDREVLKPRVAKGYADNAAMLGMEFRPGEALVGQVFEDGKPQRIGEVNFSQHFDLDPAELLRYREATDGVLPVSSMGVPLHSGQSVLGVLVLDNFQEGNAFSIDDQALVTSLSR
ncbi:MAG: GAF domain-containing protein, partial [Chloroflexota bacterium]